MPNLLFYLISVSVRFVRFSSLLKKKLLFCVLHNLYNINRLLINNLLFPLVRYNFFYFK